MASDLPDDVTTGMGQRMLRRAAVPGVIRPGLAAQIQRRTAPGGAGLATEIMRRWSPAEPSAWGQEAALTHAAHPVAAAQALTPGPSPACG